MRSNERAVPAAFAAIAPAQPVSGTGCPARSLLALLQVGASGQQHA